MKFHNLFFSLCCLSSFLVANNLFAQQKNKYSTVFELHPNRTVTYFEGMEYWKNLANDFDEIQITEIGSSDVGKPIHAVILSAGGYKTIEEIYSSELPVFLINNAIHAGEPCGVDATMMLFRDIVQSKKWKSVTEEMVIVAIPFYNIGGVLNRNSTTRANQNGPEEYGFRGNAKNLDLNRDFIKADSENAKTMNQLFAKLKPDIFLDNHTTNGADYQYVMTLIQSIPKHYQRPLGDILTQNLSPFLFQKMAKNYKMTPYVNSIGQTPFDGIAHFNDLPRYSMGYASLHDALSFTAEAHMLKTYEDRVKSTYELMTFTIEWLAENGKDLKQAKQQSQELFQEADEYVLQWEIDTTTYSLFQFDGFEPQFRESQISGKQRLYYDTASPVTKEIKFYDTFQPKVKIKKPRAYIIPQAYSKVIERLDWNLIEYKKIPVDTTMEVTAYKIKDFQTVNRPYEGHYLHYDVKLDTIRMNQNFYAGDIIVQVDQLMGKYLLETLEPQGQDSFFAWNFFDGILMQKEYFSPYVFEDEAAQLLKEHPEWKEELDQKKSEDSNFANNAYSQLYYIYQKSSRYEKSHNLYPVMRIER